MQLSLCYDAMLGFVVAEVISVRNIPKGSLGRYPGIPWQFACFKCSLLHQNQFFCNTRCITQKRVTRWRGPSPCHCDRATKLLLKKCRSGGEPLATVFDLTGLRFEPQTSRSRAKRVTARPSCRCTLNQILIVLVVLGYDVTLNAFARSNCVPLCMGKQVLTKEV